VHLAPDALRVLTGEYEPEDEGELEVVAAGSGS
jgi:hypothetical protein